MKTITNIIQEKFELNKKTSKYRYFPNKFEDLGNILDDKITKFGYGTEDKPFILSDIDFSKVNTLSNAFDYIDFEYLDISGCNIEHITNFSGCFQGCKKLKKVIGFDTWKFDKNESYDLSFMFYRCTNLCDIEGLYKFKYNSEHHDITNMLESCPKLKKPNWYLK